MKHKKSKYYYKVNSNKSKIIKNIDNSKNSNKNNNDKQVEKKQDNNELNKSKKPEIIISMPLMPNHPLANINPSDRQQNMMNFPDFQTLFNNPNMFHPAGFIIQKKIVNNNNNKNDKPVINPQPLIKKNKVVINETINSIQDLINLANKYKLNPTIEYNIDMQKIHNIKEPLIKLNKMIGMKTIKDTILNQILYYIQDLHLNSDGDFLHTCLYGPPGTGKTEIAKIMGTIFSKIGILKKGVFKKVSRSDLVAGYLGQTAIKTTNVINSCLGGVLFIDEAYSLGNTDKKDIFSKECIDTLCEALSNHKKELMVIIAGYENDLNNNLFNKNTGLNSRFNWRYKIDKYDHNDLRMILIKKIIDEKWQIEDITYNDFNNFDFTNFKNNNLNIQNIIEKHFPLNWFENNKNYFKYFGRDIEVLLMKMKIAHSRRVLFFDKNKKKFFNNDDLIKGFELYLDNEEVKDRKYGNLPEYIRNMYN